MRRDWNDPDERMGGSTGAFSKRVQRLAAGSFRSEIGHVVAGAFRFGYERIEGPIRVHGKLPDGFLYASVDTGSGLRLNGRLITRPTLHLHGAGARFDATLQGPMTAMSVVIHRDALDLPPSSRDTLAAWFDADRAMRGAPGMVGLRLSRLLQTLASELAGGSDAPAAAPTPLLCDELLGAVREAVSTPSWGPAESEQAGPSSRRRLALAAEEIILSTEDGPASSVPRLARRLVTSERTLQLAFQEQFGTGIRAFLQLEQLRRAHAMLLQAGDETTLTDIAIQHGFWHLGRFSRYYRDVYGRLPSVALRRVRGARLPESAR